MNTRALYILLAVQVLFAGALIFIGAQSRDARKLDYLERTHRVTSGQAGEDDFAKLNALLAPESDAQVVRALFGVPVLSAGEIESRDSKDAAKTPARKGIFWIYYPYQPSQPPLPPIDPAAARKLSGAQRCFVIEFDEFGRAKGQLAWVTHPLKE
jgi:hypothetical protein